MDPSVLPASRMPLKNPRPGDYLLNKTSSTEGIASKKSLELKKRYLLGETTGFSTTGIMKSDSTSVLDSKFKNFHSNIAQAQKLLNPSTDNMPSFLKNPIDNNQSSTNSSSIPNSKELKDSDEKENVYDKIVITKNELNKSDNGNEVSAVPPSTLPLKILETVNTTLVENKIKDVRTPTKIYEPIDLTTPEPQQPMAIIDLRNIDITPTNLKDNQDFIANLDKSPNVVEIIDLTASPPELNIKTELEKQKSIDDELAERSKNAIDSMLRNSEQKKAKSIEDLDTAPRSPVHETTINVPQIPWNTKTKELESDSLSSSSTSSSVEDIPHYVLESTTSPDTLPGDRFVPRVEIHGTTGELMQMDSLMIVDGKYVGDPEDLKLMKMPEGTSAVIETPTVIIEKSPTVEVLPALPKPDNSSVEKKIITPTASVKKPLKYESVSSQRKPDLKFDTRNENKIDTLKNIPMIMSDAVKPAKPTILPLAEIKPTEFIDNDKTPTASSINFASSDDHLHHSDSETEATGQALTETELSDWTADDAVSENFVDIEFALNSNKGTMRRNKKSKKKHNHHNQGASSRTAMPSDALKPPAIAPLVKDLDFDGIEFMDTGSEDSCLETYSATNRAMLKNRGYVQFIDNQSNKELYSYKSDAGYGSSPKDSFDKNYKPPIPIGIDLHEAVNKEVPGVDFIEQGACILGKFF